ncbi:MAG: hypothetical protein GX100_03090 [candidate division WS1 bacterium]|nr:hypothetical protein [candidate division WS1 bacterium]
MEMEMQRLKPESQNSEIAQPAPEAPSEVTWVVWEARRHVLVALATLVFIVVLASGITWSLENRYYGGFSLVVLLIAVLPFFVPTRYTLTEEEVQVRSLLGTRSKPWANLKVYFRDGERGVLLSPVKTLSLVARTRGIYLPYQGNGAEAQALVARHLPEGRAEK